MLQDRVESAVLIEPMRHGVVGLRVVVITHAAQVGIAAAVHHVEVDGVGRIVAGMGALDQMQSPAILLLPCQRRQVAGFHQRGIQALHDAEPAPVAILFGEACIEIRQGTEGDDAFRLQQQAMQDRGIAAHRFAYAPQRAGLHGGDEQLELFHHLGHVAAQAFDAL